MKSRPKSSPDPEPEPTDDVVHLDDLIPKRDVKGGGKKLRFGETPGLDTARRPKQ